MLVGALPTINVLHSTVTNNKKYIDVLYGHGTKFYCRGNLLDYLSNQLFNGVFSTAKSYEYQTLNNFGLSLFHFYAALKQRE